MVVLGEGVEPSNLPTFFPTIRLGEYPELHLQRCGSLVQGLPNCPHEHNCGGVAKFWRLTNKQTVLFKGYTKKSPPFVCGCSVGYDPNATRLAAWNLLSAFV